MDLILVELGCWRELQVQFNLFLFFFFFFYLNPIFSLVSLPESDPRRISIGESLNAHRIAGMNVVMNEMDYMGSHWLGSFAVYLSTCRGLYM